MHDFIIGEIVKYDGRLGQVVHVSNQQRIIVAFLIPNGETPKVTTLILQNKDLQQMDVLNHVRVYGGNSYGG